MVSSEAPGLVSELQIPPVFVNTCDHQHDQGRGQVSVRQADEETNPHVQHLNAQWSVGGGHPVFLLFHYCFTSKLFFMDIFGDNYFPCNV